MFKCQKTPKLSLFSEGCAFEVPDASTMQNMEYSTPEINNVSLYDADQDEKMDVSSPVNQPSAFGTRDSPGAFAHASPSKFHSNGQANEPKGMSGLACPTTATRAFTCSSREGSQYRYTTPERTDAHNFQLSLKPCLPQLNLKIAAPLTAASREVDEVMSGSTDSLPFLDDAFLDAPPKRLEMRTSGRSANLGDRSL